MFESHLRTRQKDVSILDEYQLPALRDTLALFSIISVRGTVRTVRSGKNERLMRQEICLTKLIQERERQKLGGGRKEGFIFRHTHTHTHTHTMKETSTYYNI